MVATVNPGDTRKEDLEKRLTYLSDYYNESICNMKLEISENVSKIIETEKKYKEEVDENSKLQATVEIQCAKLVEVELRNKDTLTLLRDTSTKLSDVLKEQTKIDGIKKDLKKSYEDQDKLKTKITDQCKVIEEMQKALRSSCISEGQLKDETKTKAKYIDDLEKKIGSLEDQRKDSESKMQYYENEISSLKEQLKQSYGEFKNIEDKNQIITELSVNNKKLTKAIEQQAADLEDYSKKLSNLEEFIKQKDYMINELSTKNKEQSQTITTLNENLQNNEKDPEALLIEKDAKIESLVGELDSKSKKICELEKLILTLDTQTRKAIISQKVKYQEKVKILEKVIDEYESYINDGIINPPAESVDSLIKILENEMDTPINIQSDRRYPSIETPNGPGYHKTEHISRIPKKYPSKSKTQPSDQNSSKH